MEEDQKKNNSEENHPNIEENLKQNNEFNVSENNKNSEEIKELTPEEKIAELEDKLTRTFAEMENQRRRFEKEKDDAFDYGGFSFAREALNLIDNLERSKQSLQNDDILKNTEALKKILEHIDIISKDIISIFEKNNINYLNSLYFPHFFHLFLF